MKTIFFDLDGTLLPMQQDVFVKEYFSRLAKRMAQRGLSPELLIKAIWSGVEAMVKNSGDKTNEEEFWEVFDAIMNVDHSAYEADFLDFYAKEFNEVQAACGFQPLANEVVKKLKAKGYQLVLATNPIFPRVATLNRIRWAGLDASDFYLITTFEDSHSCKPNPYYFKEIMDKLSLTSEDVLLVGNDVAEDLAIRKLNVPTYIVNDCLENKGNIAYTTDYEGSMKEFLEFAEQLPSIK